MLVFLPYIKYLPVAFARITTRVVLHVFHLQIKYAHMHVCMHEPTHYNRMLVKIHFMAITH